MYTAAIDHGHNQEIPLYPIIIAVIVRYHSFVILSQSIRYITSVKLPKMGLSIVDLIIELK